MPEESQDSPHLFTPQLSAAVLVEAQQQYRLEVMGGESLSA